MCVHCVVTKLEGRVHLFYSTFMLFTLHHMDAVHSRCGVLLQMSHVAWSVYLSVVCVLVTRVCCAKMAELIEMPFGGWLFGPGRHVLDGVQIPHGKGHFWGVMCRPIVTYLCVSILRIVHLRCMWRINAFAAMRGWLGSAPLQNYFRCLLNLLLMRQCLQRVKLALYSASDTSRLSILSSLLSYHLFLCRWAGLKADVSDDEESLFIGWE